MPRIGAIDERYQSFNVEMLEVTGGDFWKPCASLGAGSKATPNPRQENSSVPAGMCADLYQHRPPINLSNSRLRKLAAALGPSSVRVSGTWANTTYFHDSDTPAPKAPPAGFNGVLTRAQWKGVFDFAHAVDANVVTSFATGVGVRDAAGVWTPAEATKVLRFTKSIGAKRLEQLDDNIAATQVALGEDDLKALDEVSRLPVEYPGWQLEYWDAGHAKQAAEATAPRGKS